MVWRSFSRAVAQMGDPRFQKVLVIGVVSAALSFAAIMAGLLALVPMIPDMGVGWADWTVDVLADLGAIVLTVIAAYVFFPAIATFFMGFFLDDIVAAVEARHYPQVTARRGASLADEVLLGLKFALFAIALNLLILPLYLVLLISGVGAPVTAALFLLINGMLIGREFFEMVAVRHLPRGQVRRLRLARSGEAYRTGLAIAALFLIPFVNLIAPVLGAAMMTHTVHARPLMPRAAGY